MEQVTPIFACKSPAKTRAFYEALGFEVTYWQEQPYFYGAVSRGAIQLHFAKSKGGSTCLVHVPDVNAYHRAFADGLRRQYGRIPTADFPRLARLRKGYTRFQVFDPSGNELLFVNADEPDIDYEAYDPTLSPLMQSLEQVVFLRETYADDKAAAKLLDKKLAQHADAAPIDRARALAMRAELAVALGDSGSAQAARAELAQITLSDEEHERYRDELQAADVLERWLITGD